MKVFLVFMLAMLMVTGVAFAQEETSTINQVGKRNDATVDQDGSGNISAITQGDATLSFDGVATVDQDGNVNNSSIYQTGKMQDAGVNQQGDYNDSYISQVGALEGNRADVDQLAKRDLSDITQISTVTGLTNIATVTQKNDIALYIPDDDYNNESTIYQNGDNNEATVSQDGKNEDSYVSQVGADNVADVTQTGNTLNFAYVYQTVDNNDATIVQDGSGNLAQIFQNLGNATNNTATIVQKNSADNNTATIRQDKDGNLTRIVQDSGKLNTATFNSYSSDNGTRDEVAESPYDYPEGNLILQTGNSNTSTVNQLAAGAGDNTAWIQQDGGDLATVSQDGFQNDAYINQK